MKKTARDAFVPLPNGDRIKVRLESRREKWMLGCLLVLSLAVMFLLVKAT